MEVNSTLEELNPVTMQLKVTIGAEDFKQAYELEMDKVTKGATLKGFRPGKAPRALVEKLHGERVRLDVADKVVSKTFNDAIKEKQLDVVGSPKFELKAFDLGSPLEYSVTFEIFPRPEVSKYQSFEVKIAKQEISDASVDEVVERLRQSGSSLRKLEFRNTAQKGDVLDATVEVLVAGDSNPAHPEPLSFELGTGRLPADIEESIVGLEIGQTKELSSHIPNDYRETALRGKDATYRVTLTALSEKVLPELNDEFAKQMVPGVETVLDMRVKIRSHLEEEAKAKNDAETSSAITDQLIADHPFEVPMTLVDDEIRGFLARSGLFDTSRYDIAQIPVEKFRDRLGESATKRIKGTILFDRIAEKENLRASKEELDLRMTEIATEAGASIEQVREFMSQEGRMIGVALDVTRNKVLKFLLERTKVEYL